MNRVFLIVLLISNLLASIWANENDTVAIGDNDLLFQKSLHFCHMYSSDCDVFLLVAKSTLNSTKLKAESVSFHTEQANFVLIESFTACNNSCPSKQSFFEHNNMTNSSSVDDEYSVFKLHLNPILFGKAIIYPLVDARHIFIESLNKTKSISLVVTQPMRFVDKFFQVWIYLFQTVMSLIMGILLDVKTLYRIIKMPLPVLFGVSCQYLMMPLLAIAFLSLFHLGPIQSLALFVYGCCPGGAASNNWTIMFDGDIDLSAILTFTSTLLSLAVMPAWIYTVGQVYMKRANLAIPFIGLLGNLFITIGPCLLGLLLGYFLPKLKEFFQRIAKPFTLITLLSFLALVLYTKWYAFGLFEWQYWLAGPLIPWTGYTFSFLFAYLVRFPLNQCKTICIETGIQNVGIAFMVIITNFPSPESDYAILPLMSVACLTGIPLYFVLLGRKIYRKVSGNKKGAYLPTATAEN